MKYLFIVFVYALLLILYPLIAHATIQPWSIPTDYALQEANLPKVEPIIETLTVESLIRKKCVGMNIDCNLAVRIAKAESRFQNVPNYLYTSENGKYTAYGIFQITRTTYKAFCGDPSERMDIEKNIDCALHIMEVSGYHHWSESKENWLT